MMGKYSSQLESILRSIVSVRVTYSYEAPSRRIEGQFGGETTEEGFSEINVYLQHSPQLQNFEILKNMISECVYRCKKINRSNDIGYTNFLFNDAENDLKLLNKYLFLRMSDGNEIFQKESANFNASSDVRTINRLTLHRKIIDDNALLVFITDNDGCELSNEMKIKYRRVGKQSIWIKINGEIGRAHV